MKFLAATSGSGGHIFPAIKAAEELRARDHAVDFIGDFRGFAPLLEKRGFRSYPLAVTGLSSRSPARLLACGCRMAAAVRASFRILRAYRPDAVLGFGGYGAFPVVAAAVLARIPTLIHEQNVVPGRANRMLCRYVGRVAVSFPETQARLPVASVLTGCPSHVPSGPYDRGALRAGWGLDPELFTLLVLGGSQGSRRLNEAVPEAVPLLAARRPVQVIHITGEKNLLQVREAYTRLSVRAKLFSFVDAMDRVYAASDAAVSRAGAVCVTECALFRLPAVLIPYPHAGGHQRENAAALTRMGAAEIVDDEDAAPERIAAAVEALLSRAGSARGVPVPPGRSAAALLAGEALALAGKKDNH